MSMVSELSVNNDEQVVFLFNKSKDECGEILKTINGAEEAKSEVDRLRQQGLPAYYSSKHYYEVIKNRRGL